MLATVLKDNEKIEDAIEVHDQYKRHALQVNRSVFKALVEVGC